MEQSKNRGVREKERERNWENGKATVVLISICIAIYLF